MHVFGLKAVTEETRSEIISTAASLSSNATAIASGGGGRYLLGAPASLLSFAAANAGSSLAFMKGDQFIYLGSIPVSLTINLYLLETACNL